MDRYDGIVGCYNGLVCRCNEILDRYKEIENLRYNGTVARYNGLVNRYNEIPYR